MDQNLLRRMDRKVKQIKQIQGFISTILANGCYSEKEMETQISRAENSGKLTAEEKDVICRGWQKRKELTNILIHDLDIFLRGLGSDGENLS